MKEQLNQGYTEEERDKETRPKLSTRKVDRIGATAELASTK